MFRVWIDKKHKEQIEGLKKELRETQVRLRASEDKVAEVYHRQEQMEAFDDRHSEQMAEALATADKFKRDAAIYYSAWQNALKE